MTKRFAVLVLAGLLLRVASCSTSFFVQISDIHLSDFNRSRAKHFGDPLGDLRLFSETFLKIAQPTAILITGDLTDSKDKKRRGRQSLTEWQDYRSALDFMKAKVGIEESQILDIRGNHDTFAVPKRLGSEDFFPRFAAEGRRNKTSRVYLHHLGRTAHNPESCPAVSLVGIDGSKDPGFRGTNFFGTATAELLSEVDNLLHSAAAALKEEGCVPFFVAYGHFPLSVIAHPETDPWWLFARSKASSAATLKQVLLRHPVAAYLNGHLHSAFGQRLHRLHPGANGRFLAELETAAWVNDRRARVVAIDDSSLAFSDLFLETEGLPGKPSRSAAKRHAFGEQHFGIATLDPEHKVRDFAVVVTSPPDARYAPLLDASSGALRTFEAVRALVLPVIPAAVHERPELKVWLEGECNGVGQIIRMPLSPDRDVQYLWAAKLPQLACTGSEMHLQVITNEGSTSARRPVALRRENDQVSAGEPLHPLPLRLGWVDWALSVGLAVEWPRASYWLMTGAWGVHFVGMLLLPRGVHLLRASQTRNPAPNAWFWSLLRFPASALLDMASIPEVWWPQAVVGAYLGFGPWAIGNIVEGEPPTLLFLGRILYFRDGRAHLVNNIDTAMTTFTYTTFAVIPMTICVAISAFRLRNGRQRGGGFWPLSPLQGLLVLLFLWFYWAFARHFSFHAFGVAGGVFGSGTVLILAFFLFLLWRLHLCSKRKCLKYSAVKAGTGSDSSKSE